MTSGEINIVGDQGFPACPDCHRSVWDVVRENLAGGHDRSVEVTCRECGTRWTMTRPEGEKDWRLISHRA
jgi:hypothetical protein